MKVYGSAIYRKCFAARRKITAPTGCTCRKNKLILNLSNIEAPGAEDCLHALRSGIDIIWNIEISCGTVNFIDSLMPHTRMRAADNRLESMNIRKI